MRRTGKVVPFPLDNSGGNSLKAFAVVFYLCLAYLLTLGSGLSEEGLWILYLLGVLYNYLVRKRIQNTDYFKENKVLLVIMLVIFVVIYRQAGLVILVVSGLYWLFVGRSGREAPYFLKFHILTALILNFFLLVPALFVEDLLGLVAKILHLFNLGAVVGSTLLLVQGYLALLFMGVIAAAALWLSVSALMGRTPYIGVVTPNVRHWS